MRYFFDDGESYIELRVKVIDNDGDTILVKLNDDEIVVPAAEYVSAVYSDMGATGEELAQCAERVREYYQRVRYRDQTVTFEPASDAVIRDCLLDDYDLYREENERPPLTVDDVRGCL